MFQLEPRRTAYDVNFYVAGIPVRISPWFWVAGAVLGSRGLSVSQEGGPNAGMMLLVWLFVVFVSILVHEMGHALLMRYFGEAPHVVLYWMGGLAISDPMQGFLQNRGGRRNPYTQIVVSLAGPGAGFLLAALMIGLVFSLGGSFAFSGDGFPFCRWQPPPDLSIPMKSLIRDALWVNIFWGLVNLLPVFPLDGGQTARALFEINDPSGGFIKSVQLSIMTGILMAVLGVTVMHDTFIAILFGSLAASNYMTLQQIRGGGGGFGGRPW